ncbi:hypothetical protein B0H13DRAFT_1624231, partial [Mycena leptocephala]
FQCAIPVVECLLPEPYNLEALDVLFTLAEWHSFAKLKLHTDWTIGLSKTATEVWRLLRRFQRVACSQFSTKELDSERAARGRHQAKKAAQSSMPMQRSSASSRAKLHSLGDYIRTFLWFGTSDSYSTQPVSFPIEF